MTTARRTAEETALLGDEIYWRDIRALVKDEHDGEYLAIDVDSGDWALGSDEINAARRLRAQQPDEVDVWLMRVGYRAIASFGGQPLREGSERRGAVESSRASDPEDATMTTARRTPEEARRLGDEIYKRDIRALVKDKHDGEYVSIDLDSGDWAVADDLLAATRLLREQQPDANDVWSLRVGYRAVASLGGGALRREDDRRDAVERSRASDLKGAAMTTAGRTADETALLGDEIYERDIHHLVKDTHDGEYLAIDVDSGDWAVADDLLAASRGLRERQPDAVDVWLMRVGYRALASIGGGPLRRTE